MTSATAIPAIQQGHNQDHCILLKKFLYVYPQHLCYSQDIENPVRVDAPTMITEKDYTMNLPVGALLKTETNLDIVYCGRELPLGPVKPKNYSHEANIWQFVMWKNDTFIDPHNTTTGAKKIEEDTVVEVHFFSRATILAGTFIYVIGTGFVKLYENLSILTETDCLAPTQEIVLSYKLNQSPKTYLPQNSVVLIRSLESSRARRDFGELTIIKKLFVSLQAGTLLRKKELCMTYYGPNFPTQAVNPLTNTSDELTMILEKNTIIGTFTTNMRVENPTNVVIPEMSPVVIETNTFVSVQGIGIVMFMEDILVYIL